MHVHERISAFGPMGEAHMDLSPFLGGKDAALLLDWKMLLGFSDCEQSGWVV